MIQLTQLVTSSGCAAKLGPGMLHQVLAHLPKFESEHLLVGMETSDDAAVYQFSEEVAVIQTLDFFTPVVDNPYVFGQVAATNALSDIYAMGGEPVLALNIVGFPNCMDSNILGEILRGGAQKVKEAGAVLAGGHSIHDKEPKYGLSVMGTVHPENIWKNKGAKVGDVLLLTKPLGTGIINAAVKGGIASEEATKQVIQVMTTLNKHAKDIASNYEIHACTDITGFGLAGHVMEMAKASERSIVIRSGNLPVQQEAIELAKMGIIPEGAYRNRSFVEGDIEAGEVEEYMLDIIYDPQTSGGLLFSVTKEVAHQIIDEIEKIQPNITYTIIGEVIEKQEKLVRICP